MGAERIVGSDIDVGMDVAYVQAGEEWDDDALDWWKVVHAYRPRHATQRTIAFEMYNGELHVEDVADTETQRAWFVRTTAG